MIWKAADDDIYRIMDARDQSLIAAAVSAAAAFGFFYIAWKIRLEWETIYLSLAFGICTVYFLVRGIRLHSRVMETKDCYLEVTASCLAVRQPAGKGQYEACRIFFDEMDRIVEGGKRGTPEIYVVLRENAKKSFLLLNNEERESRVFLIRSVGYSLEAFQEFYKRLCWEVPGKVRVIGSRKQEIWNLRKPRPGIFLVFSLLILYLVPKVIVMMG